MNYFNKICIYFFVLIPFSAVSQKLVQLKSPNGHLTFTFYLTEKAPLYQVDYKGRSLISDSELHLSFNKNGGFGTDLRMGKPKFNEVNTTYELVVGKTKLAKDHHRQVIIPLIERKTAKRQVNLEVRAFNDGIAFRYKFPEQKNWKVYTLTDEHSGFNITGNPTVKTLFWDHFTNNHEGFYHTLPLSQIKEDTLMDMPALFMFPEDIYMAITEANLRDYAGMYLMKKKGVLTSQLSPLPGQTELKVNAALPHQTPWRVMLISDRFGALLESNMLTSLNEPSKIKDVSWIKPGKTSFHWWNGDITPDTTFAPGVNFETNKYYIDFCARNNIDYHAVIGYGGFAWYKSDARGYAHVGPETDVTEPVPSLDMERVCSYAKQKGVGIHVWVHWKALYPKMEEAFSQFKKWGVKGMMVDFLNRDDQEMVKIQEEILQKAAEHELYIQFHGAYKPTGLHRTYPNEFTREGTLNYENNKWRKEGLSPEHDLDIIFTRLLAGAADYHLGGFRAVPEADFKTQYTRPLMIGTRCHMLAMYIVLESYLASLCDFPEAYEGEAGFNFLKQIPTIWDETVVSHAEVGEYITVARRKEDIWYVASVNNSQKRSIKISFDFLPAGKYRAECFTDAPNVSEDPNQLAKSVQEVSKKDTLTVKLGSGGGQVMRLIKLQ